MTITTYYPNDAIRLEKLGPRLQEFEAWYSELQTEHAKRDWPYGKASLADATGLCGWLDFFEEGFTPSNALDKDLNDNYG